MSFGGGYNGGRTRMGTKVLLNIYDLSPANECLDPIGFGVYHSGVEIMGTEYTFASGSGIFNTSPKEAPGARFRESLELGTFEGGSSELRGAIDDLRNDFGPEAYNIITKNCNHFANALVWSLLGKAIPPHVNRLADIGSCVSCLFPKKLLENAPVGDSTSDGGGHTGYQVFGGAATAARSASMKRASDKPKVFGSGGSKLGTSSASFASTCDTSASSSVSSDGGSGIRDKLFGSISSVGGTSNKGRDDLTDRREKARKAALARMENQEVA